MIFFCENNLYGEGTPQDKQAPIADLALRAEGYDFPGVIVDGNDVLAVYDATQEARKRALAGEGPTMIEAKTYRFRGHYEGDPQVYRRPGELEAWKARDPVPLFGRDCLPRESSKRTVWPRLRPPSSRNWMRPWPLQQLHPSRRGRGLSRGLCRYA